MGRVITLALSPAALRSGARRLGGSPIATSVLVLLTLAGCSPLPGDTVDPVYGRLRGTPASDTPTYAPEPDTAPRPAPASTSAPPAGPAARAQPPGSATSSSLPSRPAAVAPSSPAPRRDAGATVSGGAGGAWIGRYVDSRGAGDITLSLARSDTALSGTWAAATGAGGPISGTVGADGRVTFNMRSTVPGCRGYFEGSMQFHDTTLAGTYQGQDCEGVVTDGRFEARRR